MSAGDYNCHVLMFQAFMEIRGRFRGPHYKSGVFGTLETYETIHTASFCFLLYILTCSFLDCEYNTISEHVTGLRKSSVHDCAEASSKWFKIT